MLPAAVQGDCRGERVGTAGGRVLSVPTALSGLSGLRVTTAFCEIRAQAERGRGVGWDVSGRGGYLAMQREEEQADSFPWDLRHPCSLSAFGLPAWRAIAVVPLASSCA